VVALDHEALDGGRDDLVPFERRDLCPHWPLRAGFAPNRLGDHATPFQRTSLTDFVPNGKFLCIVGFDTCGPKGQMARLNGDPAILDAVVVGAGFSGLAVAARLAKAGLERTIVLERAASIGGTWRENTYPGCACDIPSHLYSFSFAPKHDWSRLYAPQPEIRAYLEHVASTCGLRPKIRLNASVEGATWDETGAVWRVALEGGESLVTRSLIAATGPLSIPATPALAGLENFEGAVFHSATWDHGYDLKDKRVAVIGTGASAIQFVPRIAPAVARLDLYQRTPPWILPKGDRPIPPETIERFRRFPPFRLYERYRLFWIHESRADGFTTSPAIMEQSKALALRLIDKQVKDPELKRKVTPDYLLGCKRLLISSDYYPALARSNVDVITESVRSVYPGGIETANGTRRDVDAIVFGTGFEVQKTILGFALVGRGGRSLAEAWARGKEAYLGTTVSGFPNFFMMIGPNSGLAHNSQVFMIEAQARYVTAALKKLLKRRRAAIDVRRPVQTGFNTWVGDRLKGSVWTEGGCKSWYLDPVTGRNSSMWPSSALAFWRRLRRFRRGDYEWTIAATHGK
jgi:cation diffusion facilitator CzcD-associated flavoprotein CzcO